MSVRCIDLLSSHTGIRDESPSQSGSYPYKANIYPLTLGSGMKALPRVGATRRIFIAKGGRQKRKVEDKSER